MSKATHEEKNGQKITKRPWIKNPESGAPQAFEGVFGGPVKHCLAFPHEARKVNSGMRDFVPR